MRAVVTGGAGFIGSHLVERLVDDGWDVLVVDDFRSSVVGIPELPAIEVDATAIVSVWPAPQADAIFHLASPVGPLGVLQWAGRIVPAVTGDADCVRAWAVANRCPLIYVSTSEVYGHRADGICSEDQPRVIGAGHSARMEYAVAKMAAETMLLNSDMDVRVVRPFNVAGPRQRTAGGFVLPRFIAQARAGKSLTVYRPGTQRRAFTHVLDIVDGLMATLDRGRRGEVYNLGNPGNECTIRELADEVVALTGSTSDITVVDPRELHGPAFREAPDKIPDATKAMRDLRWTPTRDRATVIRDAANA